MTPPAIDREAFVTRLSEILSQSQASETEVALLLVDLSNLSLINHRHSYNLGDALIGETAAQLDALTDTDDSGKTVFRVGSHTFAVILPEMTHAAFVLIAVSRIQRELDTALFVDNDLTSVHLCIGAAMSSPMNRDALGMLTRAELHLGGVRRGEDFDLESILISESVVDSEDELQQSFEDTLYDNGFTLCYQPQINIASGDLFGVEALLRWEHQDRGFISPERVVSLAEGSGLTFELAKSITHNAARQIASWMSQGQRVPISVNVSADLISRPELTAMFEGALGIWGVPSELLTVEITEQGVVQDLEAGTKALATFSDMGVHISIDDFGTGYSSLSYFRDIPASELKIDRSFVERVLTSEQDRTLVRIIVEIAHLYKMRVVAEGVEDASTLNCLKELGCDIVQGHFVAKPMPAEEFEEWLSNWDGVLPSE
ncbi:putative bifunctional diguanylate cyclase/phosphodiesterase [Congregibacter sp.]|uniref:putative bifunctional diguanylate cyclase/phosphodiesterase n=1 Tax=Congregibacter sp. TaxID=2744308 RepID=UPI003F6C8A19